jgi:hypothetical protein
MEFLPSIIYVSLYRKNMSQKDVKISETLFRSCVAFGE